ncbi:MAG: type II secretion system minor pseudopilin GspI [Psychrobacter sp.]|uniref:type II secretion system minor pseudopilin GspI n=1 Tax=Psychrobacter submarinus TaxID=154108 RepID=UPI003C3ED5EC
MNFTKRFTRLSLKTDKPPSVKVPDTSYKPCYSFNSPSVINVRRSERGFTLIEVMVALAILAVVAVAASRASSAYLSSVDILKTRTLAHFVAQNAAADLRIQQTWLTANRSQRVNEQGRDWQVQMSVADTLSPALKQVTIEVAPILNGEPRSVVTDITVIVSNPETASSRAAFFGLDNSDDGGSP